MKPIEQLLSVEAQALKPLPALSYEPEEVSVARVRRDGHVRFDSKYYSLEETYIGQDVLVIGSGSRVTIYCHGKLVETHERVPANDPSRSKSTKPHHLKPWERELGDHSLYRKRAVKLGPDAERLVMAILAQGQGFVDTRRIWGILSLDKKHKASQINEACKQALELGSLSYRTVKSLLKLLPKDASHGRDIPAADQSPEGKLNKFVRPMSVYEEQLKLFESLEKSKLVH